jgi:hypothetical protein
MTVPVRVKPVPAQPRSGAAMPTSKSDLASRASMVTGLSCSAALPPQLGNHSQRNLDTAHRGGGRNVWTSPGTDPDPLEVAAAAESAISAPALIIRWHATYYGHDPEPRLRQSRQRRDMLDVVMREQAVKQITNLAPLIPAQLLPVSSTYARTTLDQRRGHGDVSSDTEPPDLARPP